MLVVASVGCEGAWQDGSLNGPETRLHKYDAPAGVQVAVSAVPTPVVGLVTPLIEHWSFAQVSV